MSLQQIRYVQTEDRNVNQLQQNLAQALSPLLKSPILNYSLLQNVSLASGNNTINHGLGQILTGWFVTRWHGTWASVYDLQDTNQSASETLILNASAPVKVDIYCF